MTLAGIVFLHGALGSSADWDKTIALMPRDMATLSLNFPGHFQTAFPKSGYTLNDLIEFTNEAIAHKFQNQPVLVVGHSMGGYTGLCASIQGNTQIAGIITVGTKLHWTLEIAEKESGMLDADKLQSKVPKYAAMLEGIHGQENWKFLLTQISTLLKELGNTNPAKTEALRSLKIPVKLMLGDRDEMVTLEETVAVYKVIPQVSMSILPNSYHPIFKLNTQRLAFEIMDFYSTF